MNQLGSIHIRPYLRSDARNLFEAVGESMATVGRWQGWCTPDFTLDVARAWVEGRLEAFRNGTEFDFAILSGSDRFLGSCALNGLDAWNRRANLGYWVRATETGRGVATEATRLLARWAFQNADLDRLELVVAQDNLASLRVAEKLGALREGLLRRRLRVQDAFQDALLFSLLRSDLGPT